ncbi:MAG: pyrroloquinoline quinone-dependent dehydrogenase [Hydrocarboniphaga sp.]|uniref:hypothetical protein n=1 Tax=Hydrocarboniphaga sp. TaxID=2033016 RepID=UPI0026211521|nr:hypothetical protein [Hydrocarboniphaga sp.]MDB5968654.1 pyrroloquinoline quinone-dependent dehydrogenase [Hydrocarboniphaga sp.]
MPRPVIGPPKPTFRRRHESARVRRWALLALWAALFSPGPAHAGEAFTDQGQMGTKYSALTAAGIATPMSCEINGEQYVVIPAGGHSMYGSSKGDSVMAYKLKRYAARRDDGHSRRFKPIKKL